MDRLLHKMGLEIASCSSPTYSHTAFGISLTTRWHRSSPSTGRIRHGSPFSLHPSPLAPQICPDPLAALSVPPSSAGAELPQQRMPMSPSHQLLQATDDFWTPSPWSTGLLHSHTPHLCGLDGGLRTPLLCIETAGLPDLQSFASSM